MFILYVPYILIALFMMGVVLLLCKKWKVTIIFLLLAIVGNLWTESIPMNFFAGSRQGDFTIMTWNLNSPDLGIKDSADWDNAAKTILEQNPDLVCLQEYDTLRNIKLTDRLRKSFPYIATMHQKGNNIILSKFPIGSALTLHIDTSKKSMEGSKELWMREAQKIRPESTLSQDRLVMWTTINIKDKKILLLNCHLGSNHYDMQRMAMGVSKKWADGIPSYLENLRRGRMERMAEAIGISEILRNNEKPIIVCGDLNDLSGGDVLTMLQKENELYDAWWEGGFGPGFTYHGHYVMHFRLDHVLYNDRLKLKSVKVVEQIISDHHPIVASFDFIF